MSRFVIVQEPTCNWAVFDTSVDIPATMDGKDAIGLSLSEAIFIAAKANAAWEETKSWPIRGRQSAPWRQPFRPVHMGRHDRARS